MEISVILVVVIMVNARNIVIVMQPFMAMIAS